MTFQPNLVVNNDDIAAPKDADLLNSLATVHAQFGMHPAALDFAGLANWIRPNDITTLQLMAESLLQLQRTQDALNVLNEIDQVAVDDSHNRQLLTLRGNCLAMLGQFEEARVLLSASLDSPPGVPSQTSISK